MAMSLCAFASAEDTIKIGMSGPLTGGAAVYGLAVERGAQIAVDEINALGGVQLELLAEDDENDAEKGINAFNTLLDKGAQMMLGTVTTTPCIAVSAEAYAERVFMLTPSASSTKVIEGKDNMYQVCFTDPAQGSASAQYIVDNALATKVGIIYNSGSDYSTGITQTFEEKAAELGLEIVAKQAFTSDDNSDFSVQVAAMKDAGAELVFLPIYYTPASMILKQAASVGYEPTFFGVDGMDGILSLEGFDTSLAEGVMLLTPFSADAEDEKTQKFVSTYQNLYGEVPNQFAADAYDGIYALYTAIQAAGITAETSYADACDLLIAAFQEITVEGLTGTMTWVSTGEVTKTPMAVVIKNGVYVSATK
ncbi:MAG: ABC transporter substrate-binding protein [Clostridia bacterium]|nr:ABC transporter substrate-binding protein [Clostridia bacterium]